MRFPAQELLVTGKVHVRGADRLGDSETAPASATR